jgi:outer membrane protein OmpA-like peptidoglycan-associated protein
VILVMTDSTDARAARRLSLARAMTVRDALLLGGASSEQIKMRALGANVPSGDADRVDLSDH